MPYIYHGKHPHFRGNAIYPLHRLQSAVPEIYAEQLTKYRQRPWAIERIIPILGVRWNDVVHCAPVHPYHVFRALEEVGAAPDPAREWFQIPLARIDGQRAVWYAYASSARNRHEVPSNDYEAFDPERYRELTQLPSRTVAHYREVAGRGLELNWLFHGTPHILIDGVVNVEGVETIRWSVPPDNLGSG